MKIGVIADDFTGATDIASFFVLNNMSTVQLCTVDDSIECPDVDVVVISHKIRSCDKEEAISEALKSLKWLKKNNCKQIYFKYCSTFDSSAKGNIGPITDALMKELKVDFTIFQPALPINKRTVYKGYLFVDNVLLSESGMRNHPITPMTDSYLPNLVNMQSDGKCGVIDSDVIDKGSSAILDKVEELKSQGFKYASLDALNEQHLITEGFAFKDYPLVTGGSGLAIGLARSYNLEKKECVDKLGYPTTKKAVVLSGSCSLMTNKQVEHYAKYASSIKINVDRLFVDDLNIIANEYCNFIMEHINDKYAPMLYATTNKDELHNIQTKYGNEKSASSIENLFSKVAFLLKQQGVDKFIIAGGETSSIITKVLDIKGFFIGPAIAPGVPWVKSINSDICLTLKSGNFGDEEFFLKAQRSF